MPCSTTPARITARITTIHDFGTKTSGRASHFRFLVALEQVVQDGGKLSAAAASPALVVQSYVVYRNLAHPIHASRCARHEQWAVQDQVRSDASARPVRCSVAPSQYFDGKSPPERGRSNAPGRLWPPPRPLMLMALSVSIPL